MHGIRHPNRRQVIAGAAGLLAAPAIIGTARAATRGVSDTEIIIGMMTDLSGVDFHEQVLLSYPEQATRIVFVSASAFTVRSADFLGSVPNKRLEKPFLRGELRQVVADVVNEQGVFKA